ncbi:MAG TPA: maleylpyruvate isomerase N-terminal domain-containing protein [Roseiflexaceae bacterium]|nr:maleylpyruvate isomerase N-terminal domain-containing protein [Roseiflexaceae bacterium]
MLRVAEPIETVELFPALHAELLVLLRRLEPADWLKPTTATPWSVKDMVAHLLDTDMRRLSAQRDRFSPPAAAPAPATYHELVALLNQLNADWVKAAQRLSPRLLIELLDLIGPQVHQLFSALDPLAPARVGVAWAGESSSYNWFDIAREYTEKWHHQQHIREAVGAALQTTRRWMYPVLDTFLRGLPHTYREVIAADETTLVVTISGDAGGDWTLKRIGQSWQLYHGAAATPASHVRLDQDIAWRLFTNGLSPHTARSHLAIEGDPALGEQLLALLAIMA